jgi:hypothetical protein
VTDIEDRRLLRCVLWEGTKEPKRILGTQL